MTTVIGHLDLDTFFVSCERLHHPELIGKAVIIGGKKNERGVVAACSYEAREFGVHSGMSLKMATLKCPNGIFMKGTSGLYSELSGAVTDIVGRYAPAFEKASIDEFYIDLSGMYGYLFDHPMDVIQQIRDRIDQQLGLPSSAGIGQNRLIAKIGSKLAKPNGIFFVPPGAEPELLAPLPIKVIPGIGDSSAEKLNKRGIRTVGDLQKLDMETLINQYGKYGLYLFRKARGIGSTGIDNYHERKSVSSETTFRTDLSDFNQISQFLLTCINDVGYSLRKHGLKGKTVTVKLRQDDFETHSLAQSLSGYVNDDLTFIPLATQLLSKLYKPDTYYRLVGFGLSNLVSDEGFQTELDFNHHQSKKDTLFQSVDRLKAKYGKRIVHFN